MKIKRVCPQVGDVFHIRNRTTLIERIVLFAVVVLFAASLMGFPVFVFSLSREMSRTGLKGIVENIWYGSGGVSNEVER